jgi:2',3'-cyclic-nucleotide 2'-phosphodiesterase/3'-nucleotidase
MSVPPVGKTSAPLHSYFALVADDPSVQIVSQAQTWYITDMLKDGEWKDLPVLSAAAPFKAGGRGGAEYYTDVPAGDIAIKNVADLYLYPNTVRAVASPAPRSRSGWKCRPAFSTRSSPAAPTRADQPRFPILQFRRDRRRHLPDRLTQPAKYTPKGELQNPDASRIQSI